MSPWRDAEFDPAEVTKFAFQLMDDPHSVLFVHQKGIIGGVLVPIFFGGQMVLQELFWYADEGGKLLLESLEDWGKSNGASYCMLSMLHYEDENQNKKYQKMYKRLDYTPQEIHYRKGLM